MQFNNIIGQELLKKELPELMQENRLAHALLFLGKEGSGALPLALALAQYVVCEKVNSQWAIDNGQQGPSLFGDELPSANHPASTARTHAAFVHPV